MTAPAVVQGEAPLIISMPHSGIEIPDAYRAPLRSLWLARKDADWWLPQLYSFSDTLGVTIIRNDISRTVVDVNRDPSGVSLYPGQPTTALFPTTTFDGESLYRADAGPEESEARKRRYFTPYHDAVASEIERLKRRHRRIVLYDCHSIRSRIPRLFDGILPHFNIGTNDGKACDPVLAQRVVAVCTAAADYTHVVNGRFKGGYITRHHGDPANGVHAIQMELACRGYMHEPMIPDEDNWPAAYDKDYASPMRKILKTILESLLP